MKWLRRIFVADIDHYNTLNIPAALFRKWMTEAAIEREQQRSAREQ